MLYEWSIIGGRNVQFKPRRCRRCWDPILQIGSLIVSHKNSKNRKVFLKTQDIWFIFVEDYTCDPYWHWQQGCEPLQMKISPVKPFHHKITFKTQFPKVGRFKIISVDKNLFFAFYCLCMACVPNGTILKWYLLSCLYFLFIASRYWDGKTHNIKIISEDVASQKIEYYRIFFLGKYTKKHLGGRKTILVP